METYYLPEDIKLVCVTAKSFPDGVMEAFEKLEKLLPPDEGRNLYGISYPDKNYNIIYKASAESFGKETKNPGLENFTILSGTYISIYIADFMSDMNGVRNAFNTLISYPLIDPEGCCVETYVNQKDVRCMVRLDPNKIIDKDTELKLNTSLNEFQESFSSTNEKYVNTVPPQGGWTAAQLARHVIKANSGFLKLLNGPFKETKRKHDEFAESIKISFLDFNTKLKSPDYVIPEIIDYNKEDLSKSLEEVNRGLIQSVKFLDMTKTCIGSELPVLGYLTRVEAVYFITYHTQRHTHQLKNIIQELEKL